MFFVHLLDENGIKADIQDLWHFLGMVNQLGKFSQNLAEYSQPLRVLLSKKNSWTWGEAQDSAFIKIKEKLSTLAMYDSKADTKIAADTSSFRLGAVLLGSAWKAVAFASRSMTKTERRYAHIEKEALALTWACEKFSTYILGMKFLIETPLIPLLGTKR